MLKVYTTLFLSMIGSNTYARGGNYCSSEACSECSLFLVFWLGFIGIFFLVYRNEPVRKSPQISFFIKWFILAVAAMLAALFVQADIFNMRNGLGMFLVGVTGYGVFWYGISLPLKEV